RRQRLRKPRSRLPVLRKLQLRSVEPGLLLDERVVDILDQLLRHALAVVLRQLRLVVEELQLRRCARLKEIDHSLRLRRKMRLLRRKRRNGLRRLPSAALSEELVVEKRSQRDRAEPDAAVAEEMAARDEPLQFSS